MNNYIKELLELSDKEFALKWENKPEDLLELVDNYLEEQDIDNGFIITILHELYKDKNGNTYELIREPGPSDNSYYYHFEKWEE